MRSRVLVGLLLAVAAVGVLATNASRAEKQNRPQQRAEVGGGKSAERLREGTRLQNISGFFKLTGDRITFYVEGDDRRFQALENLNLERISALVGETPDPLEWSISGTVMEYGGSNFLLVTQATLKSRSAAPADR